MYLAYYDETGDDGFPQYSSPLFVLTAVYVRESSWRETYNTIHAFRVTLKDKYSFPVKMEFHTSPFMLGKKQYLSLYISPKDRVSILSQYCDLIASLNLNIINVVINKTAICVPRYPVLDNALTFSTQRIENDLRKNYASEHFMIIADKGRMAPMRKIARRVQAYNPIPSRFQPGTYYQQKMECLIEDPLEKDSRHSHYIQVSDLVGFVVYYYMLGVLGVGKYHGRMPPEVNHSQMINWLERLKPSLNLRASSQNQYGYGIVCYPTPR